MQRQSTVQALMALLLLTSAMAATAEEPSFAKLNAKQIKARFVGKEFTDEVHYAFRFDRKGRLAIVSMGNDSQGAWRVDKDLLCLVLDQPIEKSQESCYEVWMAGKNVELRSTADNPVLPLEGVLQKPQPRQ